MSLDMRSKLKMRGCHPDLIKVIELGAERSPVQFIVTQGPRSLADQVALIKSGASSLKDPKRSRHVPGQTKLYGVVAHAVDIAPVIAKKVRWDWPLFHQIAPAIKAAAAELKIPIEWGGDWRTFKDGPHWQLPWAQYPLV